MLLPNFVAACCRIAAGRAAQAVVATGFGAGALHGAQVVHRHYTHPVLAGIVQPRPSLVAAAPGCNSLGGGQFGAAPGAAVASGIETPVSATIGDSAPYANIGGFSGAIPGVSPISESAGVSPTPVPEPSSIAPFALGSLMVLGLNLRRKRR